MSKRKLADENTDENDDGWLNTRNKKKISPPPLKTRGGHHHLRRPIPRAPLVMLMDDAPLQLTATKKQTSIADYFSPHLKELPSRDDGDQRLTVQEKYSKQEETALHCNDDRIYSDFDMPAPTPTQTETHDSQSPAVPDNNIPVPAKSQTSVVPSLVSDHFTRVHSPASLQAARAKSLSCTFKKAADILPYSQATFVVQTHHRTDDFDRKKNISSPSKEKFCEQLSKAKEHSKMKRIFCGDSGTDGDTHCEDRFSKQADQSIDKFIMKENGHSPKCRKVGEHQAVTDTGIVLRAEGENCLHKESPQPEHDVFSTNDTVTFSDSLQTPCFLNGTCNTLNFSQFPAVPRTVSSFEEGIRKTKSKPLKTGEEFLENSFQTQQKGNTLFEGFTEPNSLHFTDSDSSQDTQHWSPGPQSLSAAVNKKIEQKMTVSSHCDGDQCDSLQTPVFLSSERGPDDSQLTDRWREGSQLTHGWTDGSQLAALQTLTTGRSAADNVTSFFDDLQTPDFLTGSQEGSSSVDMC